MSIHDGDFQESVLTAIEQYKIINSAIIQDIIDEHLERKTFMEYLDRRRRRISADNWKEDMLSTDCNGVPIFNRVSTDTLKVNHRIHNDFMNRIASTFTGYMGNEITIKWDERETNQTTIDEGQKRINEFRKINNMNAKYHELLDYDNVQGTAYLLLYQKDAELRAKTLKPWECVVIKNQSTGETEYAMRYWEITQRTLDMSGNMTNEEKTIVEWYDSEKITYYINHGNGVFERDEINHPAEAKEGPAGVYTTIAGEQPHFMGAVPIIEFPKNKDRIGDCEKSIELQDAYDITLSDLSSEVAQLRLAYLFMKGLGGNVDSEFLALLRKTGVITTDENGEAKFIEKNLNSEAVNKLLELITRNIFLFSNSVDFSSEEFSGNMPIIAFKLKTKPLEESAKETEIYMTQAMYEMYRVIANFWQIRDGYELPVNAMSFVFTRNLPVNSTEEIDNFVKIKGQVSDELALSRLSFVDDIEEELDRYKKQKEENEQRIFENIEKRQGLNPGDEEETKEEEVDEE